MSNENRKGLFGGIYCLFQVCVERDQPHTSRLGNAGSRDYQIDDRPIALNGQI